MKQISIYLAGNIQKSHEKESQIYWSDADREFLAKELAPREISFLNPALRTDDLSDQLSVFGRDLAMVYCSDLIFVDARERRGLGVGAEMMWAKMHRIPLLTFTPIDTHYRKSEIELLGVPVKDWVHPFVESLSDGFVANLEEAVEWIEALCSGQINEIKGPDDVHSAMHYYRETQYHNDLPMKELAERNDLLKTRLENLSFSEIY